MDLMTVKEAAAYLKLNPVTVREWARSGRIPAFKIGRDWRFDRDRLDLWLKQQSNAA